MSIPKCRFIRISKCMIIRISYSCLFKKSTGDGGFCFKAVNNTDKELFAEKLISENKTLAEKEISILFRI